jgi:hypothetical protein
MVASRIEGRGRDFRSMCVGAYKIGRKLPTQRALENQALVEWIVDLCVGMRESMSIVRSQFYEMGGSLHRY